MTERSIDNLCGYPVCDKRLIEVKHAQSINQSIDVEYSRRLQNMYVSTFIRLCSQGHSLNSNLYQINTSTNTVYDVTERKVGTAKNQSLL